MKGFAMFLALGVGVAACGAPTGAPRPVTLRDLRQLDPDEVRTLRSLSPEEQEWVAEHPEAARELGTLSAEDREGLRQRYEGLPPEMQRQIRENPEAYMPR